MLTHDEEEGFLVTADGSKISMAKLERLAEEQQHPQALQILAETFFVRGDTAKALEYRHNLADYHGDIQSMVFLSKFYQGDDKNKELAAKYLGLAAASGHRGSLLHLAHAFQAKFPVNEWMEKKSEILESVEEEQHWDELKDGLDATVQAVDYGDGPSHLYLGLVHQEGLFGMEKDSLKALDLFVAGSTPESLLRAARMLFDGSSDNAVPKDSGRALQLLIKSARQFGNPQLKPVADMIVSNSGECPVVSYQSESNTDVPSDTTDPGRAFDLYKEAAEEGGDPDASFITGNCFFYGMGTQKDIEAAQVFYEKAVTDGHINALQALARCLWIQQDSNSEKAVSLFKKWIAAQDEEVVKRFEGISDREWADHLAAVFSESD
jgi:TPR repeat protein